MKQKFVPLEKQSKRKKKKRHAANRGEWGVNPVTKVVPNMKAYNRKKSGKRWEHESLSGFFILIHV